ncbi:hypothetical protein BDZ89DRAFT_1127886 [Hymenopellis radicata]|nr:hypothetical protein BDZ89DRAFT_1127886 [Hymenopellis radicata]
MGGRSPFRFNVTRSTSCLLILLHIFSAFLPCALASGQYVNGQFFTYGLSIINAPSANSPGHAGSPLPISVEVSGDGKLAQMQDTSLDLLEITWSHRTRIPISLLPKAPTVFQPGNYNLTFYESSRINGESFFIITPITIPIENSQPSGTCTENTNSLQEQPQAANAPGISPFLSSSTSSAQAPTLITITLAASAGLPFDFGTVTTTELVTRVIVVESLSTLVATTTVDSKPMTTTLTETYVMTTTNSGEPMSSLSGFVPITDDADAGSKLQGHAVFSALIFVLHIIMVVRYL